MAGAGGGVQGGDAEAPEEGEDETVRGVLYGQRGSAVVARVPAGLRQLRNSLQTTSTLRLAATVLGIHWYTNPNPLSLYFCYMHGTQSLMLGPNLKDVLAFRHCTRRTISVSVAQV